jgi:NitT/TauT family transport system substrate-binding protein
MPYRPTRRAVLTSCLALAALMAGTAGAPAPTLAQDKVIKMGGLKLIHSIAPHFYEKFTPAGYKVEIVLFDSPTDGKNAVVTDSVDFGMFGLAAATIGGAAGEPVVIIAATCNRGMAIVAKADGPIATVKDLKGKKVGILPGSTQEVVILDRLKAEGMTIKDIQPVRVLFGEMPAALQRGDIDAYVGAEPGPGISLATGVGKIVEYPYSTPTGSLNMVFATSQKMIETNPQLVKVMLDIHRKASEYAMSHQAEMAEMTVQKLGQKRESVDKAIGNVELTWKIDALFLKQAQYYGTQMLEMKQIRALPDYTKFINPTFVTELMKAS